MKYVVSSLFWMFLLTNCKKKTEVPLEDKAKVKIDLSYQEVDKSQTLTSVFFMSETTGFVGSKEGTLYKTTTGGATWAALITRTNQPIHDLYFLNNSEGFAVFGKEECAYGCAPASSQLLHTKDGGLTWAPDSLAIPADLSLRSITFVDDSIGFVVGDGSVFSTKNRGRSWQKTTMIDKMAGLDVSFWDKQNGLIACTFGKLMRTRDGGSTWETITPFLESNGLTLALTDTRAFASDQYTLYTTADKGASWPVISASPSGIAKMVFSTEDLGYAFKNEVNTGPSMLHTKNGGSTWTYIGKGIDMVAIKDACFPSPKVGYAVGGSKVMRVNVY